MFRIDKENNCIELIMPEGYWDEIIKEINKPKPIRSQAELYNERLDEIVNAITQYKKHKMAIPEEWIKEYNTIIEIIRNQ